MEERQRRSFTDDYKRQAVDLVASSGRSIGSVAKELGLRDSVLRRWVEQRGLGESRRRRRGAPQRRRRRRRRTKPRRLPSCGMRTSGCVWKRTF
jgi:transposase-like protein